MKKIVLSQKNPSYNFTPDVIKSITDIKNGGCISFEFGEYHFYEDGTCQAFFAPSNNETGIKKVVFPLIDCSDIVIDGNGSTFVFHGTVSPFIVKNSRNITIKNATLTTFLPSYALMQVVEKTDEKFVCKFDDTKIPCKVCNGNLVFNTETEAISTVSKKLSFHAMERVVIRYLFTKDCVSSKENLPAGYVFCEAFEKDGCIEFFYLDDEKSEKCAYDVGEYVSINLEESRFRDVFFLEDSENTVISEITVKRGGGMGIIAQLCKDIEIDRFIVKPSEGESITLTADIIHIVNCSGKLSIHDCELKSSLDDACNVHGTYTSVASIGENFVDVRYMHEAHSFLELYKKGDLLTIINKKNLDEVCRFRVSSACFSDSSGMAIRIYTDDPTNNIGEGFLIESPLRMPDMHIYRNKSENIPHWRLSGAGDIIVENNEYTDCNFPVYAFDLAEYWYESGRIRNLVIRNNHFRKARFSDGFIKTGVSGYSGDDTPYIHKSITVTENVFEDMIDLAYDIKGFEKVIIKDNIIK